MNTNQMPSEVIGFGYVYTANGVAFQELKIKLP